MDLNDIAQKIDAALSALKGVFMPTPEDARELREGGPVRAPEGPDRRNRQANLAAVNVEQSIYTSRSFHTKGWTLQNAFVTLNLVSDNDIANAPITFALELQGSLDSGYAQLARVIVVRAALGQFTFPLAANPDSLAKEMRFEIFATAGGAVPAGGRLITFQVDGVLQAGYRF